MLLSETRRILKPKGRIVISDIFITSNDITETEKQSLSRFNETTGIPVFEDYSHFVKEMIRLNFGNISVETITDRIMPTIPTFPMMQDFVDHAAYEALSKASALIEIKLH